MASQYKNLFFDLDDTLWAFSLNARDTFEEMYHKYDYGRFFRSFQHFYTLYQHRNVELWEEYGRGQVSKEELNRQRFLYPLEAVGARDTTDCRSRSVIPCVMVKNTGMVPRGFVNVKKEVKQSKAKGKIVSIAV
jgi:FMN phosphatase YigB (HAD superfamily)